MEIVVNRCFGGFGLSYAGVMEYAKKKGMTLYAYIAKSAGKGWEYERYMGEHEKDNRILCVHYHTGCYDKIDNLPGDGYFSDRDIERNDPALVAVVREMGDEASSVFAKLEIVDIPDDVDWEIDEYDGIETVHEKHRSW